MTQQIRVTKRNGELELLDWSKVSRVLNWACRGLDVSISQIELDSKIQMFDLIKTSDIHKMIVKAAADLISEENPDYQYAAARLAVFQIRKEAYGQFTPPKLYDHIVKMVNLEKYDPEILDKYTQEEIEEIGKVVDHWRDLNFAYAGIKQIEGKYLVQDRVDNRVYESPQMMYILIAMTLFANESKETRFEHIKKFYDLVSKFKISLPTPIMGGVRTPTRQFSSCVVIETDDTLNSINASAGSVVNYIARRAGIGLSVGKIRAKGSKVRGGEIYHTGITPFIKHFQTAVKSSSQGGIRGGAATLAYPIWHLEVQDMLVLKNNRGVDDNRARHLDYSVQISKLFYQRLIKKENITLFSPSDVPGLYDSFFADQDKFEELYVKYEQDESIRKLSVPAVELFSTLMQERASTGRIYIMNVDHSNTHSSFIDPVKLSNLCFTGDTIVAVADGRNGVSIKELAESGKRFEVYSAKPNTKTTVGKRTGGSTLLSYWKPEIKSAVAFKSGVKEVIEVHLSDGSSFKCTPDHEIATIDGEWIQAKDSLGYELESIFTRTQLYKQSKYRHINSISDGSSKQHRLIWEYFNGAIKPGYHVDHICDSSGDNISNLQLLSKEDHYDKTFSKFAIDNPHNRMNEAHKSNLGKWRSSGTKNPRSCGLDNFQLISETRKYCEETGLSAREAYLVLRKERKFPGTFSKYRFGGDFEYFFDCVEGKRVYNGEFEPVEKTLQQVRLESISDEEKSLLEYDENRLQYLKDTFYKELDNGNTRRVGLSVIGITKLGEEDVYDLTVEDNHNFYILTDYDKDFLNSSGVLVHNCQEITLPTHPLQNVNDENGEIALCTLSAANLGLIDSYDDFEEVCEYMVRALDNLLSYQDYLMPAASHAKKRRALGIGWINLAFDLARRGLKYSDGSANQHIHDLSEAFQYYLLKASVKLARERGACEWFDRTKYSKGILPIDTYKKEIDSIVPNPSLKYDWEGLRADIVKYGLRNSTLSSWMPSESSSIVSNSTNGIEPPRGPVSVKGSKDGILKQIVPDFERLKDQYEYLWDIPDDRGYLEIVGIIQKFGDQSISANTFYDPLKYGGKVPMTQLLKDLLLAYKLGVKTLYYHNTRDSAGEDQKEQNFDTGCESGACAI